METCRLSTSHVRIGVPLPGDIFDEAGNMLLSKGYVLTSESQIAALLARGMYVELATFEAFLRTSSDGAAGATASKFDPFLIRSTLKIRLHRLLNGTLDSSTKPAQLGTLADDVAHLVDADADAAIAASFLDRDDASYATGHCLNAAILCALAAHRLEWGTERRRSVVCAALTMNLGMLDLQHRLLRQATPLTAAQREQLQAHPEAACAGLEKIGVDDAIWLAAVRQHHETPDGQGYPAALAAPSEEAGLVRLSDIIDARTANRADRRALPAAQVIRTLFVEEGQGPFAHLVGALVKLLGLYPPGSFVRLANNEAAVVFRHGSASNTPIVAAITAAAGMPLMQPIRRETQRKDLAIAAALTADKLTLGYDLAKLWITTPRR
jgi:HD-GYP domain-containing protein (c-di-GMP phosphodiesterase class II)